MIKTEIKKQELVNVDYYGKYLVVAYDEKLNIVESVSTESLQKAREFMRIFFRKLNAHSVEIAKLTERWVMKDW